MKDFIKDVLFFGDKEWIGLGVGVWMMLPFFIVMVIRFLVFLIQNF